MLNLKKWMPILDWLPNYKKSELRGDTIAGLTVAMMLIPQAMSYAMLAGLPPIYGLYASMIPILAYAVFGTSRQLAVGPAAMVALLVSSAIGSLSPSSVEEYIWLAILLAGLVGIIQLLMGIFKLGFLTNFMSHPVISGFTSAAALIIIFSQLGHILGIALPRSENILEIISLIYSSLDDVHIITLFIGAGSMVLLMLFKVYLPLLPGSMAVLLGSTVVVWLFDLESTGVSIVGFIPAGLPSPEIPELDFVRLKDMLPVAITIAFIGFIESIAVAKKIAQQKRYELNANNELVGLGMANILGSLFQAMPVAGGFGRTAVNNNAGANTALASIITVVFIILSLLFLTPLFYFIPKAVLGAIIIMAVYGLIDLKEARHLWVVKKEDLALLGLTFIGVLLVGVKEGIFLGIIVSMVWFVTKTTRPHYAVLGRIPGTSDYRNIKRHDVEVSNSVLILRFDAQFYYGNVSFLKDTIRRHQAEKGDALKAIVIEACSINQLDSSADTALHELIEEGEAQNIKYFFSYVKGPVLDVMHRSGLVKRIGSENFFNHIHAAVESAQQYASEKAQ